MNQFTPNDDDRYHSALAKPVDSVIRKRSNSICHFHCLDGNSTVIFFNNPAFFSFAKSLLAVDLQLSDVSCSYAGYVAQNIDPIPAIHQRIFNQLIQNLH